MQAGLESYAEKLKSRGAVKDVDGSIQEVGGAFTADVTPESVAFEKFLVCAIPDLDKKKDIQGVLEFLADICKKDPVAVHDQGAHGLRPARAERQQGREADPVEDVQGQHQEVREEEQRQLQAWEYCGKRSRKGKKALDLEAFLIAASDYMEARGELVQDRQGEAARITGQPLPPREEEDRRPRRRGSGSRRGPGRRVSGAWPGRTRRTAGVRRAAARRASYSVSPSSDRPPSSGRHASPRPTSGTPNRMGRALGGSTS